MCRFYKKVEIIEQPTSSQSLISFEHNCSKVYTNDLKQEVRIMKCLHFNLFKDCPFFEEIEK